MLPNLAFSSVSTQPLYMDLLDDVATRRKHKRRPKRYQTRPWLVEERRRLYGHYSRLMEELRVEDPQSFFNYLRMEPAMFDELAHSGHSSRI